MNIENDQFLKFLPKEHPELPPFFRVTFELRNGREISFDTTDCTFISGSQCFQVLTTNEEIKIFPRDVVAQLTYDKRFIKIKEIERKIKAVKEAEKIKQSTQMGGG